MAHLIQVYVPEVNMRGIVESYDPQTETFLILFSDDSYGEVSEQFIERLH